jgi:hypothetical protein
VSRADASSQACTAADVAPDFVPEPPHRAGSVRQRSFGRHEARLGGRSLDLLLHASIIALLFFIRRRDKLT